MKNSFLIFIIFSIKTLLSTHGTFNASEVLKHGKTSRKVLGERPVRSVEIDKEVPVELKYDYESYKNLGLLYALNRNNAQERYIISDQMVRKDHVNKLCLANGFSSGSLTTMSSYLIDANVYTYLMIDSCKLIDSENETSFYFKLLCEKSSMKEIERPVFVFCTKHPYYFDSGSYLGLEHNGEHYLVCHIKSNAYDFCKSFGTLNRNFYYEFDQIGFPSKNKYADIVCSSRKTENTIRIDEICGFIPLEENCVREVPKINCQRNATLFESSLSNADLFYLPDNSAQLTLRVIMKKKRLFRITYIDFSNYCRGFIFTFKRNCLLYHEEKNGNIVTMFLLCKEFAVKFNKICLTFGNSDTINILSYKSSFVAPVKHRNMVISRKNFRYKISPPFLLQHLNGPSNKSENGKNLKDSFSIVPKMNNVQFSYHWSYKPFSSDSKKPLFNVENFIVRYQTSLQQFTIDANNLNLFIYLPLQNNFLENQVSGTYKIHQRLKGLRDDYMEMSWKIEVVEVWDKPVCEVMVDEDKGNLVSSCALKYSGKYGPRAKFKTPIKVPSREVKKNLYKNAVSYDYIIGLDQRSRKLFEFYKKRAEAKSAKRDMKYEDQTKTGIINREDEFIYCIMLYNTTPYSYEEEVKCDIGSDSLNVLRMLDGEASRWSGLLGIFGILFIFLVIASIIYVRKTSARRKHGNLMTKPEKVKHFSSIKRLDMFDDYSSMM